MVIDQYGMIHSFLSSASVRLRDHNSCSIATSIGKLSILISHERIAAFHPHQHKSVQPTFWGDGLKKRTS